MHKFFNISLKWVSIFISINEKLRFREIKLIAHSHRIIELQSQNSKLRILWFQILVSPMYHFHVKPKYFKSITWYFNQKYRGLKHKYLFLYFDAYFISYSYNILLLCSGFSYTFFKASDNCQIFIFSVKCNTVLWKGFACLISPTLGTRNLTAVAR